VEYQWVVGLDKPDPRRTASTDSRR
jgi:hypothetical protein